MKIYRKSLLDGIESKNVRKVEIQEAEWLEIGYCAITTTKRALDGRNSLTAFYATSLPAGGVAKVDRLSSYPVP